MVEGRTVIQDMQGQRIRLLLVEDVKADAERTLYHFQRAGVQFEARRVETGEALIEALEEFLPALILSDYTLPRFDGMSALRICRERAPTIPFVFFSGTIGEERAVAALQAGAADYVLKDNVARLVPAVRRALGDAAIKAERSRQATQIARLNRVLRMLKGVNEVVIRCRDRAELLTESCRLAISVGGYAMAAAATQPGRGAPVRLVACDGQDGETMPGLRAAIHEAAAGDRDVIGKVLRTGKAVVAGDCAGPDDAGGLSAMLATQAGLRSMVALPLFVDGEACAVLLLAAREPGLLGEEEMGMLHDLADSLSFGLQYVQRDIRARFLSHFDPQTGLARRALFCDRVREMVAAAKPGAGHAVVLLDIRRLGAINDSFGRLAGDHLLRHVADSLKRHYGSPERVGHFGGGTFAVLVVNTSAATDSCWQSWLQQQTQALFGQPFAVEGRRIPVSVRAGCAVHPEDAADAMTLVQNAETALQVARATGEPHARFDSAAQKQNVGSLALEHRLRLALEHNEFELYYQPKVNVVTRRIQGAEALMRWRCPEEGLIPPATFLPALEASGLILDVGQWVVRQAASDLRAWKQAHLPPVRMAVNIAPAQLRLPDFEERFLAEVRPWASRAWGLDIEITEGVLHEDCGEEIRKLERLRAMGVGIAIDDFGTGYSSLSRLATLPVSTLKIDRRFVSQIVRNPTGASVVKTVVSLARAFNMTSVAEGVERQEELDQLWHIGCDQSQGFLHCAPLPAGQFAAVLEHGKGVLLQPPEVPQDEDGGPERLQA
jgi:diguanylate cyclase (GGDEF)-like protein